MIILTGLKNSYRQLMTWWHHDIKLPMLMTQLSNTSLYYDEYVQCRVATIDDLWRIVDLQRASYGYVVWNYYDLVWDWKHTPYAVYIVLIEKRTNQIIGFVNGRIQWHAHLSHLVLLPSYQGQGYGRQLLAQWLSLAGTLGSERMTLEVREHNETAIRLYERMGFVKIMKNENYYQHPVEAAWQMEWNVRKRRNNEC